MCICVCDDKIYKKTIYVYIIYVYYMCVNVWTGYQSSLSRRHHLILSNNAVNRLWYSNMTVPNWSHTWMVANSCTSWTRWIIQWFKGFQPSFWCRISQPSTRSSPNPCSPVVLPRTGPATTSAHACRIARRRGGCCATLLRRPRCPPAAQFKGQKGTACTHTQIYVCVYLLNFIYIYLLLFDCLLIYLVSIFLICLLPIYLIII